MGWELFYTYHFESKYLNTPQKQFQRVWIQQINKNSLTKKIIVWSLGV